MSPAIQGNTSAAEARCRRPIRGNLRARRLHLEAQSKSGRQRAAIRLNLKPSFPTPEHTAPGIRRERREREKADSEVFSEACAIHASPSLFRAISAMKLAPE